MKMPVLTAALIAGLLMTPARMDETEPTPRDALKVLSRLIGGEWVAKGKSNDGARFETRTAYAWGINPYVITAKTWAIGFNGKSLIDDHVFFLHHGRKRLQWRTHSKWGNVSEGVVTLKDETLHFEWKTWKGGPPIERKQTMRFLDEDTYRWVAWKKDGEEWAEVVDMKVHREK